MTLANRITLTRAAITAACLVMLHFAAAQETDGLLLDFCTAGVLVAAFLDVLDGYMARRHGEVTRAGRVLDPLVDKILICGCFIFFTRFRSLDGIAEPWVAAVLVVREFAVHAIRLDVESAGVPFGASAWGKLKTLLQTTAAVACLLYASHLSASEWSKDARPAVLVLVLLAVASTVGSGIIYVVSAVKSLRGGDG